MASKSNNSYEDMLDELNIIIDQLQSPQISVDESVVKYERAMSLINDMQKYLQQTEIKIIKIKNKYQDQALK